MVTQIGKPWLAGWVKGWSGRSVSCSWPQQRMGRWPGQGKNRRTIETPNKNQGGGRGGGGGRKRGGGREEGGRGGREGGSNSGGGSGSGVARSRSRPQRENESASENGNEKVEAYARVCICVSPVVVVAIAMLATVVSGRRDGGREAMAGLPQKMIRKAQASERRTIGTSLARPLRGVFGRGEERRGGRKKEEWRSLDRIWL